MTPVRFRSGWSGFLPSYTKADTGSVHSPLGECEALQICRLYSTDSSECFCHWSVHWHRPWGHLDCRNRQAHKQTDQKPSSLWDGVVYLRLAYIQKSPNQGVLWGAIQSIQEMTPTTSPQQENEDAQPPPHQLTPGLSYEAITVVPLHTQTSIAFLCSLFLQRLKRSQRF